MGVLQSQGCLSDVLTGLGDRKWAAFFEHFVQIGAVDVLHHEEMDIAGLFGVVGGDDVGVMEAGGRMDLTAETLASSFSFQKLAPNHFECDFTIHHSVLGEPDCPHAAYAQRSD